MIEDLGIFLVFVLPPLPQESSTGFVAEPPQTEPEYRVFEMTTPEKDAIRDAVRSAYDALKQRCVDAGLTDSEMSSSLYSVQDFCGSIDHVDGEGLLLPDW